MDDLLAVRVTAAPLQDPALVLAGRLSLVVRNARGAIIDELVDLPNLVTTAGKGYMTDAWQGLVNMNNMKYHGCGTLATAAVVGDTGLGTETTPGNQRTMGTTIEGAQANIFRTVARTTFTAPATITEWGLFSQIGAPGGIMFARVAPLGPITVTSGYSVDWTYEVPIG